MKKQSKKTKTKRAKAVVIQPSKYECANCGTEIVSPDMTGTAYCDECDFEGQRQLRQEEDV